MFDSALVNCGLVFSFTGFLARCCGLMGWDGILNYRIGNSKEIIVNYPKLEDIYYEILSLIET